MESLSLFKKIISGRAGAWASPVRAYLSFLELLYSRGVAIRNRKFDLKSACHSLGIPVISIGNITAGGTGKTPFVIEVVRRLEEMGKSPAVIARGYKADGAGTNDEERLIRKHCPGVVYVADPDRVRGGTTAKEQFGADVIVLDDGFQHRRLERDLDVVLVDATCPFGYDRMLPRGLLREPIDSLKRAHVVAITRADQVSTSDLQAIDHRLRSVADRALHIRCSHAVSGIQRLDGSPIHGPFDGKRVVIFAGIGNPTAFRMTVLSKGFDVVGERIWPDHHNYRRRDIESLLKIGRFPPHDMLLTTEKDAVKLAELGGLEHMNLGVVRISIDFADDGSTILQQAIENAIQ